jgi:hypothetical protein
MPTPAAATNLRNLLSELGTGYGSAGCGPDAGRLQSAGRVRKTDPGRTYGMSFTAVRAVGRVGSPCFDRNRQMGLRQLASALRRKQSLPWDAPLLVTS